MTPANFTNDRHLLARDFVKQVDHPMHGEVPLLGFAPMMSNSDVPLRAAPLLGEHTASVLGDELGLDEAEISSLREAGSIG